VHTALHLLGDPPVHAARPRWAVAGKGFRPFFLLAAAFAALFMPLWMACLRGALDPGVYLDPPYWHAHEMLFGFVVAVMAGFLLTAVGNWTQRATATGLPLLSLAALWVAGRAVIAFAALLPPAVVAAVDLAFIPALMAVIARPLVLSGNRRNFVMVALLGALFLANAAVHLDALGLLPGGRRTASLAAVDLVILVILVIAGRVFPMFTRNATGGDASIRSHRPLDVASLAAMASLVVLDVTMHDAKATAVVAGVAGVMACARAVHWGALRSLRQPLLWVLHVGYAWIPVGLLLRAASSFTGAVPSSASTHALTAGAIGVLTMGMMARVALGHTGRALSPSPAAVGAFWLVALAAVVRVGAPLFGAAHYLGWLMVAGTMWTGAFALYLVAFAPALVSPRADGKSG
jgi:uncharacterized protein involved in response to NO